MYVLSLNHQFCDFNKLIYCTTDASLPASSLMRFARNIVQLGIDEGLVPLITEVESKCREKVYDAEEEYESEFVCVCVCVCVCG